MPSGLFVPAAWRRLRKSPLSSLQKCLPSLIAYPVLATPKADYPYRIILPKTIWAISLSELALEQNWSNFKNEVAAYQGQ